MRRILWALGAALLVASVVASGPAYAQGDKGDFEIGAFGGYGWLDEYGGLNPKDGPLYGARIGYFFSRHVGLELSGQRLSTHLPDDQVDVHLDSGRANLMFNFDAQGMIRPFVTGGIGFEKLDVATLDDKSQMTWNAGAGVRMFPSHNFNVRLDGNYMGMKPDNLEDMQSNYGATVGIGWLFGGGPKEETAAVTAAPNGAPTVTCAADRNEILAGQTVKVHATASDPEGDPLDYIWTTTAGHVVGMGADASLDFAGATPPTNATITVKVRDNHGNSATSDCSVALSAPPPPAPKAEAVSCLAGGFPKNLSRLTNVDKACLDDVAQRLKSDPQATVTVIGYADSHEKSAKTIADARAKAVRDYLTTERSIDSSRITVRSSGATNPVATGTDLEAQASNRRVVVWFVPAGTTIPEQ